MTKVMLFAYAFLVGITVSGLLASAMQILTGQLVRFQEPYVSNRRIPLSLLATIAIGPMMLGNEALAAWREGRAGTTMLWICAVVAVFWASAMGIIVTEGVLAAGAALG